MIAAILDLADNLQLSIHNFGTNLRYSQSCWQVYLQSIFPALQRSFVLLYILIYLLIFFLQNIIVSQYNQSELLVVVVYCKFMYIRKKTTYSHALVLPFSCSVFYIQTLWGYNWDSILNWKKWEERVNIQC